MMRPAPDDRHPGGGPDPVLVFLIAVVASWMCMFITLAALAGESLAAFT